MTDFITNANNLVVKCCRFLPYSRVLIFFSFFLLLHRVSCRNSCFNVFNVKFNVSEEIQVYMLSMQLFIFVEFVKIPLSTTPLRI